MSKKINYVPILKWKAAEQTALKHIPENQKESVTPLAELVLPSVNSYKDKERKEKKTDEEIHTEMVEKMIDQRFEKIVEEIDSSWGKGAIYLDVTLLHNKSETNELKVAALKEICKMGKDKKLKIIPVLNVADDGVIVDCIKNLLINDYSEEICLRVTSSGLRDANALNMQLSDLVNRLDIAKNKVHILIDLKHIEPDSGSYEKLFKTAQNIEDIKSYNQFIFASGAFPLDMSDCQFEEPTYLPRIDWEYWKKNSLKSDVTRIPTFSDYSIRHPYYSDSLQFFEATTTLKYTTLEDWMIMKGRKREFGLYLANASLLVQQEEFKVSTNGELGEFSFGDKYIVDKAGHFEKYMKNPSIKGTGRTQDWIAAGISHHTALVMHQLSILAD